MSVEDLLRVTVDMGQIEDECFVLMPFGPKFDPIFEEVLRPAVEQLGLVATRADSIYGSRRIINANVRYELGLAHALGKPFVIITNRMDDVPFDLKDVRCIVYDKDHPKWGESLSRNVARTMRSVIEDNRAHEPLFPNIDVDGAYSNLSAPVKKERRAREQSDEPAVDLSGYWRVTQNWPSSADSLTTLYLEQHGSSLAGYTLSTPLARGRETEWSVSQEVSGSIRASGCS